MRFTVLNCLALVSVALAAPSPRDWAYTLKEKINPPRGWRAIAPAPGDAGIKLKIGLPQERIAELKKHLSETSNPWHERYGQHLSFDEVNELVAPAKESKDKVLEWLSGHGFGENDLGFSKASDWVYVHVPIRQAEEMLKTKYHVFQHEETGKSIIRCTEYSIPEFADAHVDLIQPTTSFFGFKPMKSFVSWPDEDAVVPPASSANLKTSSGNAVDPNCTQTITLDCLAQIYNYEGYVPSADVNNSIGITGYLNQSANFADLQQFYADQKPEALNTSFKVILVNGGENSQNLSDAGAEANLDVQFAFGTAFPINGTFWSTGGSPPFKPDLITPEDTNEPYTEWLDFVTSTPEIPLAISTSYGDDEQTVPESFAQRACDGFAQLGARGVSLMFSSGDGGVGDNDPDPETTICKTNDGQNKTVFIPSFPASCPFVTAVGGTVGFPEVAVSRFFSGAGFSNYFDRPDYQEEVVTAYVDALAPGTYDGLFNKTGRAYPDVAAQSDRYRIFLSGAAVLIGGTSASSPAFTGIVSLLNDARLKAGKTSLGFLNPLLYSTPESFNDITVGNSTGCGTSGFNATEGWDPVTGLGTPNFALLKDAVLAAN